MLIRADIKCYYCGFVSGQIEGDPASAHPQWSFQARSGLPQPLEPNPRQLRCIRCRGPVFLDEIETVRTSGRASPPTLVAVSG
jgi:hypothetical protein